MLINKKRFLFVFVGLLSWLLVITGAVVHLSSFSLLAYMVVIYIFTFCVTYSAYPTRDIQYENIELDRRENNFFVYLYIVCFALFIFKVSYLLWEFDFNFQYVRNVFFSADGKNVIFGGNKFVSMFYDYVIVSCFVGYLITKDKYSKMDFFAIFLFCLAGLITGGRFNGYKILILSFLLFLSNIHLSNKVPTKIYVAVFFVISLLLGMSFNRAMLAYDLDMYEALVRIVNSIYDYHSVQIGVFLEFQKISDQYLGPFTGLFTPIYTLFGMTSPEGVTVSTLNTVAFGERGYNAFGTSASFFSYWEEASFIMFFFFVNLFFLGVSRITHFKLRKNLNIFLMFSLYFSAFHPYMFGFSWWVTFLYIAIYYLFISSPKVR